MTYVVTAAYVTLRTQTDQGEAVLGYYRDAPLPDGVNRDDLDRLVRKGMVVEVKEHKPDPEPVPDPEPDVKANADADATAKAEAEAKANKAAAAAKPSK